MSETIDSVYGKVPSSHVEYDELMYRLQHDDPPAVDTDVPNSVINGWQPRVDGAVMASGYATLNNLPLQKPYAAQFYSLAARSEDLLTAAISSGSLAASKKSVQDAHSAFLHLFDMEEAGLLGSQSKADLALTHARGQLFEAVCVDELLKSTDEAGDETEIDPQLYIDTVVAKLDLFEIYHEVDLGYEEISEFLACEGENMVFTGLEEKDKTELLLRLGKGALNATLYLRAHADTEGYYYSEAADDEGAEDSTEDIIELIKTADEVLRSLN